MSNAAVAEKPEAEERDGAEKKPLWWGLAAGTVILSLAVGYRIVTSNGSVDIQTGADGIQVKISEAQKTIESAQQEVGSAQHQLDSREQELTRREQALIERESKVQELLASLDRTAPAPRTMTPQQAQVELKKLRSVAPVTPLPAEPTPVRLRIEKLDQLRGSLVKTSTELNAASKAPAVEK